MGKLNFRDFVKNNSLSPFDMGDFLTCFHSIISEVAIKHLKI
jgi:hypothetical protein